MLALDEAAWLKPEQHDLSLHQTNDRSIHPIVLPNTSDSINSPALYAGIPWDTRTTLDLTFRPATEDDALTRPAIASLFGAPQQRMPVTSQIQI